MIVLVINIDRRPVFESEGYTPISGHPNCVAALQVPLEFMQPEPWQVHAFRHPAAIKCRKGCPSTFVRAPVQRAVLSFNRMAL